MGRHVFLWVLGISLLAIGLALFLPGGQPPERYEHLPWQIEVLDDGRSRVFGITLGQSTLAQVEQRFQEPAKISLFANDDGSKVVEAYFNSVNLNGFRARIVAVMDLDQQALQELFDRGERIASLAQGQRKVSLSSEDLQRVRQIPVVALTYLPKADLPEAVVRKRFGEPAERIREADGLVTHWLYPDRGLDIVIHSEAREVLQYVMPAQFHQLREPLEKLNDQP